MNSIFSLKEKLKNKELTIGSWITIPSIEIVEIMSTAGFEWLVVDMEHTSLTIDQAKTLIHAIQANSMSALVRVSKNEEVIIKRVLDCGADGIIVPMIKNEKDAKKAVSFAKYPPHGKRGVGLNRAQNYGISFNDYKRWVENEMVVIAQIEHIDAVNNISDIINVNGIDGTIIGPYDLSASMGYPGEYNKEVVKNALEKVENQILKSSVSLGFHVIESDHLFSLNKIKKDYSFIAFSIDFLFIGDMVREQMQQLKSKI
jgi:2-dehydro-3-deoxyglucarate aldolase